MNAVFTSIEGSHIPGLAFVAGAIHGVLRGTLLSFKQPMFLQGVLLGIVFLGLLALNLRVTRFLVPRALSAWRTSGGGLPLVDLWAA